MQPKQPKDTQNTDRKLGIALLIASIVSLPFITRVSFVLPLALAIGAALLLRKASGTADDNGLRLVAGAVIMTVLILLTILVLVYVVSV